MVRVFKKDVTVPGGSFNAIEDRVMQSSAISNSKYANNNKFMIFDSESKLKVTASSMDLTVGIGKAILCGCLFDNDVVTTLTPSRPTSSTAKAYLCLTIDINGTTGQKQFFEDVLGDVSNFPVLQKDDLTEIVGIKHQVALASYTIDSNGFITNFVDMTPNFVGEGSDALSKTGGAMAGDIDMQGNKIIEADMESIQQRDNFIRITLDPPDFTQGVANEKFKLLLPAAYFTCEFRIKAAATYQYENSAGLMEKSFNIMTQPNGTVNMNNSSYTRVEGNIADYLAIGDMSWDTSSQKFEFVFSKLSTDGNVGMLKLILEFEGTDVPTLEEAKQIEFSSIYTTDSTIPPKAVLQTRGNEIVDVTKREQLLKSQCVGMYMHSGQTGTITVPTNCHVTDLEFTFSDYNADTSEIQFFQFDTATLSDGDIYNSDGTKYNNLTSGMVDIMKLLTTTGEPTAFTHLATKVIGIQLDYSANELRIWGDSPDTAASRDVVLNSVNIFGYYL